VIEIKGIARRAGVRSKIAVWSADQRVDCVGACVGMRGNRIKSIVDELDGERIDIVPWSNDPIEFISNALKPAEIEEVILCEMIGRAIVLVTEENLSLAIGRYGQNVYLATKLVGWDIEILTQEELQNQLDQAVAALCTIPGVSQELAENLTGEGFTTYDDLSIIEPDDLMEMSGLSEEEVNAIIEEAERRADEQENQQNLVRDELM
jgi:N utilization substance protein A